MRVHGIKKDFEFLKDRVAAVLVFGSAVRGEPGARSDVDVCLVRPKNKMVLLKVFEKLGNKYDVKIFEDLPLPVKMDIIKEHLTLVGDEVELSHYFYRFRKVWKDVEPRIKKYRFKGVSEMARQRGRWVGEREVPQKI